MIYLRHLSGVKKMLSQNAILLLIAGYIRKTNHPEETDEQIAAAVTADLRKVNDQVQAVNWKDIKPQDYPQSTGGNA